MTLSPKLLIILTLLNSVGLIGLTIVVLSQNPDQGFSGSNNMGNQISKSTISELKSTEKPGAVDFAGLLEQRIQPVKQASSDHNEELDLPTKKEIAAAVDTNRLDSVETLLVLEKLRKGYEHYNMPFPSLRMPDSQSKMAGDPPSMRTNDAGPEIESWLAPTIERLRTEIGDQEEDELGSIPSDSEQKAAIDSEAWDSQETKLVLDILRKEFSRFNVDFPEPKEIKKLSQEKSLRKKSGLGEKMTSKERILQAYFKGQLQRLRLESNAQEKDISAKVPSDVEVLAAIKTEGLKSEASALVLEKLKSCYEDLGLTFYEPPMQD